MAHSSIFKCTPVLYWRLSLNALNNYLQTCAPMPSLSTQSFPCSVSCHLSNYTLQVHFKTQSILPSMGISKLTSLCLPSLHNHSLQVNLQVDWLTISRYLSDNNEYCLQPNWRYENSEIDWIRQYMLFHHVGRSFVILIFKYSIITCMIEHIACGYRTRDCTNLCSEKTTLSMTSHAGQRRAFGCFDIWQSYK